MEDVGEEHAPLLDEDVNSDTHHASPEDISDEPDCHPYCDPGFSGLFTASFAALCAAFASLCGLLFGYDQGVISIILVEPQFVQRFTQVADNAPGGGFWKGLLTAMIEVGALLGAFNQGWIADKISRKYSIMLASSIFTFGSIMQTSAQSYEMLVLARFIGGIGIGMLSMVAPLYISEISPPEIRGTLLVLEALSIVFGIVVAFWLTYGTQYIDSEWAWRLPFLLQILPGLVLGFGIYFLPFSPRWLAAQGRDQEALSSLCRLRQLPRNDEGVLREWVDVRAEVRLHQQLSIERHPDIDKNSSLWQVELAAWTDLFRGSCWRRTQVGVGVMFFQQFVGINAVIYYAPEMLAMLGIDRNSQLIMSGMSNMAQLVGITTSLWTMDRLGRRALLLSGSIAMFTAHLLIAILAERFATDWTAHATAGWTCVMLLLCYMLAFGATWGPVPWALPSEIFPSSLRAKGVAISSCSNWLNNSIIGLITPVMMQRTAWGTYAFFAFFCLASAIWTYALVPETAGKSLEQMDHVFGDITSEREEQRRRTIFKEIAAEIDHA